MSRLFVPKNSTETEHRGRLDRVIFNDPSQPFCILLLDDGSSMCGPADADAFARGTIYRFLGRWEDDPKRGYRFKFSTYLIHAAHSKSGVVKYLTEVCEGIGTKLAGRIYDKFAAESVSILRDSPGRVADDCDIDAAICGEASRQLTRESRFSDTKIELFTLFDRRGFSGKLIEECLDKWQENAPATIRRNPFALLGMPGCGFKRCDKLWTDLGLPKDSLKRSGIIAWNLVKNDTNGHTWISAVDLADKLRDTAPGCDPKRAFKFALRARKLKKHADAAGKMWLATYHRATSEERIAASINRLSASPSLWPTDRIPVSQVDGDKLPSEHQVERLKRATRMPVGLLLGGPGTGKSHITAYLLREVIAEHGQSSILACAPTGKAAVRMTQAFALAGLSLAATTIHRTLEIGRNGHDGDGWGFTRNRNNPLDAKFIVADESSMDDCDLLADLLDAVPNGGHILLIGDPYQLPPVGHGAPLRDLIAAGVPHGELTEVRRNAGQIVHACVRIKNGESFEYSTEIDLDLHPSRNLQFIHAKDDKAAVDALIATLKNMKRFHPVWQTQVIVARNKAGDLSRKVLNEKLHPLLNPDGHSVAGNPFKVGDKIICTRNSRMHRVEPIYSRRFQDRIDDADEAISRDAVNYDVVRDFDNNPEETYVANGEIGRVVAIAAKLTIARFSEGEFLVKIPMGKQKDDDEEGGEESSGRGCNFDHAYAVTCHRMQGSEVPCAITMGDEQGGMIANREWLYTAMSRPSKLNILIGKMSTFDKMRGRVGLSKRKTFLNDLVFDLLTECV